MPKYTYSWPNGKPWRGDDGRTESITLQGKYLKWQVLREAMPPPESNRRGLVMGMSKASRMRLLSLCAKLDWNAIGKNLFVTLTYPDECADRLDKVHQHRAVFWRAVEKHRDKRTACLWRLEWQPRKSGKHLGKWMPHYHLLIFGVPYLGMAEVNSMWRAAIGATGYVRTEVQAMRSENEAGHYVAKYASKPTDCSLVNVAYHNTVLAGRQWGVLRKNLLPMHKKKYLRIAPSEMTDIAKHQAKLRRPEVNDYGNESFTLLGPSALIVAKFIFGNDLDTEEKPS